MKILRYFSLMILFLISCQSSQFTNQTSNIGDGGLLSSVPCSAPCFFNVVPGSSDKKSAEEKLIQNGVYANCDWDIFGSNLNCPNYLIWINDNTSLVERISFVPSVQIKVGELIDQLGTPDYWLLSQMDYGYDSYQLKIYYNAINVKINLESQTSDKGKYVLTPVTQLISVAYLGDEAYGEDRSNAWLGYAVYSYADQ